MPTKPETVRATTATARGGPRPLRALRAAGGDACRDCSVVTPARSRRSTGSTWRCDRGEVVGLVGESGSGKSTLGRALLGLVPATYGSITCADQDLGEPRAAASSARSGSVRADGLPGPERRAQPVDDRRGGRRRPAADPRHRGRRRSARSRVVDALERVGLSPVELFLTKYPRDLSGGQKQRVVIARAIILQPRAAGRRRAGLDARHERAGEDPAADARPQAASSG